MADQPGAPHWLSARVQALSALVKDGEGSRPGFLSAVEEVVIQIAARPEITASFAAYEGLLVATAGVTAGAAGGDAGFDALAATAQQAMELSSQSGLLGRLEQMVLVGPVDKLAIVRVGPLLLGILSPRGSSIAQSTA